jgi:hypothetical protein
MPEMDPSKQPPQPALQGEKAAEKKHSAGDFYCPQCAREMDDPLICGDCSAVICRVCGTPLEAANDLGIG